MNTNQEALLLTAVIRVAHHGQQDSPVLTWQASTRTMNPTVSQAFVDEQLERDPTAPRPNTWLAAVLPEAESNKKGDNG